MNVSSGGLSFDFTATNDTLKRVVQESRDEIAGLADASKQGGKVMDAAFKAAFDRLANSAELATGTLSEQRAELKKLQAEVKQLKSDAGDAFMNAQDDEYRRINAIIAAKESEIRKRKKAVDACKEAVDILDQERVKLERLKEASDKASGAHDSLKKQLRAVYEELAVLNDKFERGVASEEDIERIKQLQNEAGRLKNVMDDARTAGRVFSDDNANLTGAIAGFNGLMGAVSAAQGAMGMFGVSSENVQKAMLKVQSAMAITTGIQQVYNALNKDSAFMLVTVRKAKELLAAAELKLAAAFNISAAAARGWMAAISLGITAVIAGVVYLIDKLNTASAEAEEFKNKVADAASEPVAKVELLSSKWRELGDDMEAKRKFIEDNKKAFEDLGVSILDVVDAENLLINNKDAFIEAQIEKAKAATYIETQKENIKKLIKAEQDLADARREQAEHAEFIARGGIDADGVIATNIDGKIREAERKIRDLKNTIREGYQSAAAAEEEGLNILRDAQIKATQQGQEASDAFTEYIMNGTTQAEDNFVSFSTWIRRQYNGLLTDLTNSTNSFANGFADLLSRLFGGADDLSDADGTIGDRLNRLKTKYREATDKLKEMRAASSTATAAEIEAQQKEVDRLATMYRTLSGLDISPRTTGGGAKPKTEAEKYEEELKKRKALYQQYITWATSSDVTVREAAVTEFAPLLEGGKTYLAYLEQQRDSISEKATKTALDLQKLQMLNNEIAEQTKDAVIKDFQSQLDAELQQCTTLGAMLDLLARRRQEVADDETEVGDQRREIITKAEDETKKDMERETAELLSTYVSYEAERLKFASTYARKRELLDRALAEAQTDDERAVIEAAIKGLEEQNAAYTGAKTKLYADLLEQYKTHEQQLADIQKKYGDQRREAEKNGNIAMIQLINAKEQEEISKLAAARLMSSESWSQLFTDTSRLATGTINRLIKEIEKQKLTLSAELSPADLKAMNDQLERARDELSRRNPFLALHESLADLRRAMSEKKLLNAKDDPILTDLLQIQETYNVIKRNLEDDELKATVAVDFADTLAGGVDFVDHLKRRIAALQGQKIQLGAEFKGQHELDVLIAMLNKVQGTSKSVGQGFKDTFADVGSSIAFVSACFNSVVDGMKKMGISMDEETEAILGDIGGIMEGAQQLSEGIATGNPLSIIQGSISLFTSAFDIFNSRDRKAEKAIKKHEEALTRLKNAYNALEDAVNRALGETVYQNQSALIRNLRQQQAEINGMISAEYSKKHTDNSKIEEWREQYAELGRQIQDIIEEITQSITQTTAKDLAGDLADALVEAFEGGEDAAKAFGEVADDVIKKAVVNALKLQLLEQPLQNAIKQLQKDMGFDAEGNGNFDGLTEREQKRFKDAVEKAGANFQAAMDMYKDLFEQLDDSDPTTLSGAIKGASQESIDLLAGQTNAVRQNQVTALSVMREQLLHLSNIDSGVGTIATRLLNIYNLLTSPTGTSMRSQGITD